MIYQEFTKEESRELGAFKEVALSEQDAIHAVQYPYGKNHPSAWDNFYNKWLAMDLTRTGGFPSVSLVVLLIITAPITLTKLWLIDPIIQKIKD